MDKVIQGIFIILCLAVLTSGCVTTRMYVGNQQSKEQIAIIRGSLKYYVYAYLYVHVIGVDGIPCYSDEVEVLPGWHEIQVSIDRRVGASGNPFLDALTRERPDCYSLRFNAMPGHKYRVKSSFWKTKDALISVVDTLSGEIVASQPRKSFQTFQEISGISWYWYKPDVGIEQLKQDYSECRAKGEEKSCMEERGYVWVHTNS